MTAIGVPELDVYIVMQSSVIEDAYALPPQDLLWLFELPQSPIVPETVEWNEQDIGITTWQTLAFHQYDWQTFEIDPQDLASLQGMDGEAALLLGEFSGPATKVPVVAFSFSYTDAENIRRHYLIPLERLHEWMYEALLSAASPWQEQEESGGFGPCDSPDDFFCRNTYATRMREAFIGYTECLADNAPPVNGRSIACFVLCAPLLGGTPIAYGACVAGCTAGVAGEGVIDAGRCSMDLEANILNARLSYCGCLDFKERNCPERSEIQDPSVVCP